MSNLGKNDAVKQRLLKIFDDAFEHDGFSDFHVEIKILKRQQKEVIIHYGKQYRYVLDYMNSQPSSKSDKHHSSTKKLASVES